MRFGGSRIAGGDQCRLCSVATLQGTSASKEPASQVVAEIMGPYQLASPRRTASVPRTSVTSAETPRTAASLPSWSAEL